MDIQTNSGGGGFVTNRQLGRVTPLSRKKPFSGVKFCRGMCFLLVVMIMALALSAGQAWSLETSTVEKHMPGIPFTMGGGSDPLTTTCHSYLEGLKTTGSALQMDRDYRHRAGTSAAFGFVFGVRFALSPPEMPGARKKAPRRQLQLDFWQPRDGAPNVVGGGFDGHGHALAMSAYRDCRREEALKALSDFRWSR